MIDTVNVMVLNAFFFCFHKGVEGRRNIAIQYGDADVSIHAITNDPKPT